MKIFFDLFTDDGQSFRVRWNVFGGTLFRMHPYFVKENRRRTGISRLTKSPDKTTAQSGTTPTGRNTLLPQQPFSCLRFLRGICPAAAPSE